MKRIVSLILALSMVLSMFTMSFAGTSLKDIEGKKYQAAVEALIELGVVSGYPDGTYLPEKVVTRAELAKLLVVAYGLETAAESAKGVTPFADINAVANHWAAGYINVSADYKFVNGYPDGSFKADTPVTYAEAITMCLRVLGYANEIDARGTWPTNYIAKAQDLKLMKDIEFKSYNDGAKRGDIALLIWNMLRTKMWTVTGETEGDGLHSEPNKYMLNVKFADYAYDDTAKFDTFKIEADKKDDKPVVKVTLAADSVVEGEYEYAGNNFYQFAPGTEVEVLVNKEDKTLLTMVATDSDKLVAGGKDEVDDDYSELREKEYDYAYARIESRAISDATILVGESKYVDELESEKNCVYINDDKYDDKKYDSELFLRDGERVQLRDIKVGDILTKVTVNFFGKDTTEEFYVIGGTEAEGRFKKYEEVEYDNSSKTYKELTVGSEKYVVDTKATYVEDPEAKTIKSEDFYTLTQGSKADKMEGEDVIVKLDPMFGKVVRVEFDGKIDAGEGYTSSVKFFAVVNGVDKKSGGVFFIGLENEDGSDDYDFAKNSPAEAKARTAFVDADELAVGSYVACVLNDEDKITEIYRVASYGELEPEEREIYYGDKDTNEKFVIESLRNVSYNKDEQKIGSHKVSKTPVVVKVIFDNKGTKRTDDDEFRVEFTKGLDAVSKAVKEEDVLVIYDADSSFTRISYVVLSTDKSDKSDKQVATVESKNGEIIVGSYIDLKDEKGNDISAKVENGDVKAGTKLLVYTTRENSKGDTLLTYVAGLKDTELKGDYVGSPDKHGYVGEVETNEEGLGRTFKLDKTTETDLDTDANTNQYEDYLVVLVKVGKTDDYSENNKQYEVTNFKTTDYANIDLVEGDRISIDQKAEVIFVISGMEKIKGDTL